MATFKKFIAHINGLLAAIETKHQSNKKSKNESTRLFKVQRNQKFNLYKASLFGQDFGTSKLNFNKAVLPQN